MRIGSMAFGEMTRHDMVILPGAGFPYENGIWQGKKERRRLRRNA
jgi:hypothetical protein